MKSDFSLNVDLTNPGQFLACCGILELASKVNPDTLAWFSNRSFHLNGADSNLLKSFISCDVIPDSPPVGVSAQDAEQEDNKDKAKEPKSPPVLIGPPFNLRLDWWASDPSARIAKLITWSGGANIPSFFVSKSSSSQTGKRAGPSSMRDHAALHLSFGESLFEHTDAISTPAPFNFDSRLSRNAAIHLGFVPSKEKQIFTFSPSVEILTLVGLQRFRPCVEIPWKKNVFHSWSEPLPVNLAAAVTYGLIPSLANETYAFSIIKRDSEGKRKLFGTALLERNSHV